MDKRSILDTSIETSTELLVAIGSRAKGRRIALRLRQKDLAEAAGVTLSTLRRFEAGESVGLDAVARIAIALRAEREFGQLFPESPAQSLDEVLENGTKPQRVRLRR